MDRKFETTLKLRAYTDEAENNDSQVNSKQGKDISLELEKKNALLEEEKSRSFEHLKTIVQLRESHKQEQAKMAEMVKKMAELETQVRTLSGLEAGELAKLNAQLEEEKRKSLELSNTLEQQRKSIRHEQARAEALEAKAKDLTDLLGKISAIAATKAGQ